VLGSSYRLTAIALLILFVVLAGGAALRESATVDEVAHIGAGLSYVQQLDLRLNEEHPPLAKVLSGIALGIRGISADYGSQAWKLAQSFFPGYIAQWAFGDAVLGRWNSHPVTLFWARIPMMLLAVILGWIVFRCGTRLGGPWGGLLSVALYVTTPALLTFGPLVLTDVPVTLFCVAALWMLGDLWALPSKKNALRFGLALGAALLTKFTALLLFVVILALFVKTRFWPGPAEPAERAARKHWRRDRWRAVWLSTLCAAALVYVVYFVFSIRQPDDALSAIGGGGWAWIVRRPLMPVWLYARGVLLTLIMSSRPTFLFGNNYPHGVPYYFPVVFALKSTLGCLLVLITAAIVAVVSRRARKLHGGVISEIYRPHWLVLSTGLFVFLAVCLLSRLNISVRHFLVPAVLLLIMVSPLPRMLQILPGRVAMYALVAVMVAASFAACFLSYPYFMPFVNSLSMGRPAYALLNDSNVSWNEGLPAVQAFVRNRGLNEILLDWAGTSDATLVVPQARDWDCQTADNSDGGKWVVVAAISIIENRSCGYLLRYPSEPLAGGSMYAFHLPSELPAPGSPGGPPRSSEWKRIWGLPFDFRTLALAAERNPGTLPVVIDTILRQAQAQRKNSGH
jgi:hypothetical protein